MFDLIAKGGVVGWVIVGCSIFALAGFIEKALVIYRARINMDKFLKEIEILVKQDQIKEAEKLCDRLNSPITRVVKAGIQNLNSTRERIANRMEEVALVELPRLEERMGILVTVAQISPLLGLLGTVIGMMQAFQVIQDKTAAGTMAQPLDLAGGIWVALITTVLGLCVAIPTLVGYNYLRSHLKMVQHDMERAASCILTLA